MKCASKLCGVAVSAASLMAAVGIAVQTGGVATDVEAAPAAPVHSSPPPPPPSPAPPTSPTSGYVPGNPDPNPGAEGGGGGGGGGG